MKVEIVEFYPIEKFKKHIYGTLHVYLPDLDIDYRGFIVGKTGSNWFFKNPTKKSYDFEDKKELEYPVFAFCDVNKNKEFRKLIMAAAKKYIVEKWLPAHPEDYKKPVKEKKFVKKEFVNLKPTKGGKN